MMMMLPATFSALPLFATLAGAATGTTVEVTAPPAAMELASDSDCPSADAVAAALAALVKDGARRPVSVAVRSTADGGTVTVEMSWSESAQPERRTLDVGADCDARARATAVVVAAWLGTLPDGSLAAPAGRLPGTVVRLPVAAGTGSAVAATTTTTTTTTTATTTPPPPPVDAAPRSWLGLGLVAGAGAAGASLAPGLRLEWVHRPIAAGIGWSASALVVAPRDRELGPGTSRWMRPALALAAHAGLQHGSLRIGGDAGLVGGLTLAWGRSYPNDDAGQALSWGATAALRLGWESGGLRPWIEARAVAWLRKQSLRYEATPGGAAMSAPLPGLDAMLALGWSLALP